jgi:hypothetical protein
MSFFEVVPMLFAILVVACAAIVAYAVAVITDMQDRAADDERERIVSGYWGRRCRD